MRKSPEQPRYTKEEALEEASKIKEKIEKREAKGYEEAERLVEAEKVRLKVEEIISNLEQKQRELSACEEGKDVGSEYNDSDIFDMDTRVDEAISRDIEFLRKEITAGNISEKEAVEYLYRLGKAELDIYQVIVNKRLHCCFHHHSDDIKRASAILTKEIIKLEGREPSTPLERLEVAMISAHFNEREAINEWIREEVKNIKTVKDATEIYNAAETITGRGWEIVFPLLKRLGEIHLGEKEISEVKSFIEKIGKNECELYLETASSYLQKVKSLLEKVYGEQDLKEKTKEYIENLISEKLREVKENIEESKRRYEKWQETQKAKGLYGVPGLFPWSGPFFIYDKGGTRFFIKKYLLGAAKLGIFLDNEEEKIDKLAEIYQHIYVHPEATWPREDVQEIKRMKEEIKALKKKEETK